MHGAPPMKTNRRRFLSTSIRRASSAAVPPWFYRGRPILATMRSTWFIRPLAKSIRVPLPALNRKESRHEII